MAKIVWTPANSEMGIGAVVMERPLKPLTLAQYRSLLANKINRMVEQMEPEEARRVLWEAEDQEGLSLAARPMQVGDHLEENSDHLVSRSGMSRERWPIPPEKIKQTVDLTLDQVEAVTLPEFLGALYPGL